MFNAGLVTTARYGQKTKKHTAEEHQKPKHGKSNREHETGVTATWWNIWLIISRLLHNVYCGFKPLGQHLQAQMSVGARKETFMSQEGQLHAEGMVTNVTNAAPRLIGRPCGLISETRV